jgi:septum formation protein
MRLILASASPRRADILRSAGFSFEVLPTAIDESRKPGEPPAALVERLAREKAKNAAKQIQGTALVLGADTIVVVNEEVIGKPRDADDARAMLLQLSGRSHGVLTGIALLRLADGVMRTAVEETKVFFLPLTEEEITGYIATGEPFGKAGAYAIQGHGERFVQRIEGDYWNVVGLPLSRFQALLREMEEMAKELHRPDQ